jgi:transposase
MNITTLGIDLAKNTFSLLGMDKHGKIVLHKTITINKLRLVIA